MQSIRDPELGLEETLRMMETILIDHSENSFVLKRSHESYCKSRDNSGREPTMNGREPAMATVITSHNCIRPGHKKERLQSVE